MIKENKSISEYSREELIGNTIWEWDNFHQKWTILIHWHKPYKKWAKIFYKNHKISRIWVDTWSWKKRDLTGLLINSNSLRFINSGQILIDNNSSFTLY